MENWLKAIAWVFGLFAAIIIGIALAPLFITMLGVVAGVAVAFLPVTVLIVLIVIVKVVLDRKDGC